MRFILTILISILLLLILSFCIYRIFTYLLLESKYKKILLQEIPYENNDKEPFTGALYFCALLVFIYGNAREAEKEIKIVFRKSNTDWGTYCRAAESLHSLLNGDLCVEGLASAISRNSLDNEFVSDLFIALVTAEYAWDSDDRGIKPSIYLARLLDYTIEDDELSEAYRTLGLSKNSSFAQVKIAHRKLAAHFHPDAIVNDNKKKLSNKKTSSSSDVADELEAFMKIQNAFEVIKKHITETTSV